MGLSLPARLRAPKGYSADELSTLSVLADGVLYGASELAEYPFAVDARTCVELWTLPTEDFDSYYLFAVDALDVHLALGAGDRRLCRRLPLHGRGRHGVPEPAPMAASTPTLRRVLTGIERRRWTVIPSALWLTSERWETAQRWALFVSRITSTERNEESC